MWRLIVMATNNKNNKVIAFKSSNEIMNCDIDFEQDFYLDYENKHYIELDFILQKLHLNKEQWTILTSCMRKLKQQLLDEIVADDIEFQAKKREHEARMEHYKTKLDELNYTKEQLDNGVAIEDLEGIAYFDGDFGSFGLSL